MYFIHIHMNVTLNNVIVIVNYCVILIWQKLTKSTASVQNTKKINHFIIGVYYNREF